MILTSTVTITMDNSGSRQVRCIKVFKKPGRSHATVGDVIKVIILNLRQKGLVRVKKSELHFALVTRVSVPLFRKKHGYYFKFDSSAVVLLAKKTLTPSGTRIFGPCSKELRNKNYLKIVSLASTLI
jgi:large subunit ribosomal protein L14